MKTIIIFILITNIIIRKNAYKIDIYKEDDNIEKCLQKLYNISYDFNTLFYNGISANYFPKLDSSVIINRKYSTRLINKMWKFNLHIILEDNLVDLNKYLNGLFISSNWNTKARFILVYFGGDSAENIFRITWSYYITNICLVDAKNSNILTHYPYKNGSCGKYLKPTTLAHCSEKLTNVFENKIPSQLNGCEIRLMGLNLKPYVIDINGNKDDPKESGLEVTVMHTIANKMNFTDRYLENPFRHWGYLEPDGNLTMMLKYLYDKKADIIFGKYITLDSRVIYVMLDWCSKESVNGKEIRL